MTDKSTPKVTPPDSIQAIRSQADLEQHWRMLMGPLGFSSRQLWLSILDCGGRPTPFLSQVDELVLEPDVPLLNRVMELARQMVDAHAAGGSLALLLARPGSDRRTPADARWADVLEETARLNGVPLRPIYLATNTDVRVIAPDDRMPATA